MERRKFVKTAFVISASPLVRSVPLPYSGVKAFKRNRPGDAHWPGEEKWLQLNKSVNGNLIKIDSPWTVCKSDKPACEDLFKNLKNPYYIGDNPGLIHPGQIITVSSQGMTVG